MKKAAGFPGWRLVASLRSGASKLTVRWRWGAIMAVATFLLAYCVFPVQFPLWDQPTYWLTGAAVVLSLEFALVLHEVGHAALAHHLGHEVRRIVIHGFRAETILGLGAVLPPARDELRIALMGPGANLLLAALTAVFWPLLPAGGPLHLVALLWMVGNLATAASSLIPFGSCDGARALQAARLVRVG